VEFTIKQIQEIIGGKVLGDENLIITGVSSIENSDEGDISFIKNEKFASKVLETKASAVVSHRPIEKTKKTLIIVDNPFPAFIKLLKVISDQKQQRPRTIHPSAAISKNSSIGNNISVGANVVIDGNNIHDAKDRYGTGEHIDGITINADLPECNFPQPKNIIVKNNKLINNTGQNIFVWSNYIYCIGYIQNISITNNTIGNTTTIDNPNAQGYGNPLFMPVQFGSVKNFIFNQNTVYGTVAVRLESEGQLMNNLISGYLTYENTTNIIYEDYNLVKGFYAQPNTNRSVLGNFSLQSEVQFANVAAHDYRPVSPLSVCTMSSISGHVGALPCVGQQGNCEIKKAYWKIA